MWAHQRKQGRENGTSLAREVKSLDRKAKTEEERRGGERKRKDQEKR